MKEKLKGIINELLENVQELSYASDRNEDCGNVFSSLKSVAHHLNEDLKDLEGI